MLLLCVIVHIHQHNPTLTHEGPRFNGTTVVSGYLPDHVDSSIRDMGTLLLPSPPLKVSPGWVGVLDFRYSTIVSGLYRREKHGETRTRQTRPIQASTYQVQYSPVGPWGGMAPFEASQTVWDSALIGINRPDPACQPLLRMKMGPD
jgi:hypothetical protein